MREVLIDGIVFVPKESETGSMAIVVLERGYVYVGNAEVKDGWVYVSNARCLITWGTTKHLGQLAKEGPTSSTKLGEPCEVKAPLSALIHLIRAEECKWKK